MNTLLVNNVNRMCSNLANLRFLKYPTLNKYYVNRSLKDKVSGTSAQRVNINIAFYFP